ncbi:aspartate kinase [Priestia megaterium]|uniref:aspartate kinase n=1 Tax=Priestia megaterium TaxID=1404 RepID=UPI002E20AC25|nr:aspartate kinase [Priestia megaterium]MED4285700.1 aspartate kinase [Priestia megaterium]
MKIIVQKFGGTSVASSESRQHCFKHIRQGLEENYKVIVVVSAMGRTGDAYATDTLISLAPHITGREKDLLMNTGELISACVFSSELVEQGISSRVLTGGQAGIITNNDFNEAGILELRPERMLKELETTDVLVVTGFQGISDDLEITTLGRGGSDTSATALGASVNAEYVDIFTDVEGVMTADPRIVQDAQILLKTTYNEICNLAYQGAKVIHPRAVEIAMQYNIPIRVRSTFSDFTGTLITNQSELDEQNQRDNGQFLTGITQTSGIIQFVVKTNMSYSLQDELFSLLENSNVSLDLINITQNSVGFTVKKDKTKKVEEILTNLNLAFKHRDDVVKISLVGASMTGVPGVVRKIVHTLYANDIPILQSTDSHTTIWVLVPEEQSKDAIRALHNSFGLDKPLAR